MTLPKAYMTKIKTLAFVVFLLTTITTKAQEKQEGFQKRTSMSIKEKFPNSRLFNFEYSQSLSRFQISYLKLFNIHLLYSLKNASKCKMKEKKTRNGLRLLITFDNIKSTQQALKALSNII